MSQDKPNTESTALETPNPLAVARRMMPTSLEATHRLAATFASSSLVPDELRENAANVFVVLLAGVELGMTPMSALRNIHVIKGRTVLSADLMVGLCESHPACVYFKCVHTDDTYAEYETKRRGRDAQRMRFTIEQARTAKLLEKKNSNWQTYPAAMLRARAKSALARDVYPDVLAGVYIPDELDLGAGDVIEVPVQSAPAPIDAETYARLSKRILAHPNRRAATQDKELMADCQAQPDALRAKLRELIEQHPGKPTKPEDGPGRSGPPNSEPPPADDAPELVCSGCDAPIASGNLCDDCESEAAAAARDLD